MKKMTTPIKAFITFDTIEGKDRCLKYLSKKLSTGQKNDHFEPFKLLDEQVNLRNAPEPSNIIWENLQR